MEKAATATQASAGHITRAGRSVAGGAGGDSVVAGLPLNKRATYFAGGYIASHVIANVGEIANEYGYYKTGKALTYGGTFLKGITGGASAGAMLGTAIGSTGAGVGAGAGAIIGAGAGSVVGSIGAGFKILTGEAKSAADALKEISSIQKTFGQILQDNEDRNRLHGVEKSTGMLREGYRLNAEEEITYYKQEINELVKQVEEQKAANAGKISLTKEEMDA